MKISKLFFVIFFLSLNGITIKSGLASVNIRIDDNVSKSKILFVGFEAKNFTLNNEANQILQKIIYNLKTTNLVEIIVQKNISPPNTTQENQEANYQEIDINTIPDFDRYAQSNIEALVLAQFSYDAIGNLELRIRMWDIIDRKQTFGKFYSSSPDNYRRTANSVSNEIFKSISGETFAHFDSQIVYIAETGNFRKRIKKITTIDFDGENYQNLTDGSEMVLTPIFSQKRDEIFYLKYFQNKPQIFQINTKTLNSKKIGGFRNTTLAPSQHPKDPNKILLTSIEDGNSDIHELNIVQNFAKKLTKSPAIDTTASYSPDGNMMVFVSDRDESQQIYKMNLETLAVTKISNGDGLYSKPMWSPDSKLIAFTKQKGNKFFVGVMNPDGHKEKLLTSAFFVEGARWSPSGRYLIYSKKRGSYGRESIPRIFTIDIITGHEYEIPTPRDEGATDPDWSN